MSSTGTDSVTGQLEQLLATGRQMLAVARDGDWDSAGELQARCHSLAQALFASPVPAADVAAVAKCIGELQALQQQVMDLCTGARDGFTRDIDALKQGRHAVTEYSANSG
jgi:hypothetical protein